MSDHKTCEATLTTNALMDTVTQKKCKAQTEMAKLNFYHIDINWNDLRNKISFKWESALADKSSEEMLSFFIVTCEEVCREYVPLKSV